jgi:hypothetical protein
VELSEDKTLLNLWDALNLLLRGIFIVINIYIKKGEISQINRRTVPFLYTNNKQFKTEFVKSISFILSSKRMK